MANEPDREARSALERAARESDTIGSSSLTRMARRAGDHFAGRDAIGEAPGAPPDPIELWGRRIGRSLSVIGVVVLAFWLGAQLRLW